MLGARLARRRDRSSLYDHNNAQPAEPPTIPIARTRRCTVSAQLSNFARSLSVETAFTVLAMARALKAAGKDVVELEIGDSPFDSTAAARAGGMEAIKNNQSHYCPSPGIPEFRAAAAEFVREEFDIPAEPSNIVAGPGAKVFEQFFCEAFLNPGDGVLVFSPYFPTYLPNIERRGARAVLTPLQASERLSARPSPTSSTSSKTIRRRARSFLNSPHNPTGGVTTQDDLKRIADVVRGRDVAVFSDEPYCHMVWRGSHHSILSQPGMLAQSVGAYTFSKSYSMSGWRLGFAVASVEVADVIGKMINTTLSCTPPIVQLAGTAALKRDKKERDEVMLKFREKVVLLTEGLNRIEGFRALDPTARSTSFRTSRASATSSASRATAWRCSCCKAPTTSSASRAWAASASARPAPASCASAARSRTSACSKRSTSSRRRIARTDRLAAWLDKNPQYRLAKPYAVE